MAGGRLRDGADARTAARARRPAGALARDPRRRHERQVDDGTAGRDAAARRGALASAPTSRRTSARGASGSGPAARRPTSRRGRGGAAGGGEARRHPVRGARRRLRSPRSPGGGGRCRGRGGARRPARRDERPSHEGRRPHERRPRPHGGARDDARGDRSGEARRRPAGLHRRPLGARVARARRGQRRRRGRRHRPQQPRARGRRSRVVPRAARRSACRRRRRAARPPRASRRAPLEIWDGAHNLAGIGWLLPRLPAPPAGVGRRLLDPARQAAGDDAEALSVLGPTLIATQSPNERALPRPSSRRSAPPSMSAPRRGRSPASSRARPAPCSSRVVSAASRRPGGAALLVDRFPCTFWPRYLGDDDGRPRKIAQDASMTALVQLLQLQHVVCRRDVLILFGVVFWLALGYWTYKDARRRIESQMSRRPRGARRARAAVRGAVRLHALPPAGVPRRRARARARDPGDRAAHVRRRPPLSGLPGRGGPELPRLPRLHDEAQAGVRELRCAARADLADLPLCETPIDPPQPARRPPSAPGAPADGSRVLRTRSLGPGEELRFARRRRNSARAESAVSGALRTVLAFDALDEMATECARGQQRLPRARFGLHVRSAYAPAPGRLLDGAGP